ncbi:MAG: hypothetical protein KIT16_08595 [Rhodospirillaceae bacterium]|nr:hypothetical protein [Rhodospirillaceae bacterium]
MKIRNLVLAGSVAIAAALSSGAASAAPGQSLSLSLAGPGAPAVEQAYYGGYYGKPRICYVPFYRLVRWYGYYRAKMIKRRCFGYGPYYY